jgi:PIN domain nuclease of toxin-antitoxin system
MDVEGDAKSWVARALAAERIEPVALDSDIAVQAGQLGREFPGDPADRIIYATARALDAPLVTKDRRLRSYDRRRTLW